MKKIKYPLLLTTAILTQSLSASVSYIGTPLLEDFTGYDGLSGPVGWDASGFSSGSGFTENRGSDPDGVSTGGTYAFNVGAGNIALGVQPGETDFTPGYYELQVVNNSGATVDVWNVAFTSYVFNDQDRSNSFNFSYSTNGLDYTDVAAGSFTSSEAADGSPSWQIGADYADAISASVTNGQSFYARFTGNDVSGSGSRDQFAIDDLAISAVPEPSSTLLVSLAGAICLLRRKK